MRGCWGGEQLKPTMTIREVMAYTGKSKRTIQTCINNKRHAVTYVTGRHGRQAEFQAEEVLRLKEELDTPTVRIDADHSAPKRRPLARAPSSFVVMARAPRDGQHIDNIS
jgi:hypothetical protein